MKQISMKLKTVIALLAFAGLFACNEDKGNYNYNDINEVTIADVDNQYIVSVGDQLTIRPRLNFSQGEDETLFTHTWYYLTEGAWEMFHEGRNLELEVADPFGKEGDYSLAYEVINNETGIPYRRLFGLRVVTPLTRGFVALCELDGGFDIDLVALLSDKTMSLYKNILDMTGSELPRQGVIPRDIVTFPDEMAPDPFSTNRDEYSVYLLTNQYTTRIKKDYSWQSSYDISNSIESGSHLDKEYKQQGKPIIAEKMKIGYRVVNNTVNTKTFIYHKETNGQGNWYLCNRWPMWSFFSVQMNGNRDSGGARYEPAPDLSLGQLGAMYYDTGEKKFMYGSFPNAAGTSQLFYTQSLPNEADGSGAFKFSDPSDGLLHMSERQRNGYSQDGYAILKAGDSYKYIEYNLASTPANVIAPASKIRASLFPAGSNIDKAKFLANAPYSTCAYLFYVTTDNKVYRADVSGSTATITEITTSILKSDGYSEITAFKYLLPNTSGQFGAASAEIEQSLAVATYNPSLGKNEGGKLRFFYLSNQNTGELTPTKYPTTPLENGDQIEMSWTGLGKIVALDFKQQ
jgi:hypothetical protein